MCFSKSADALPSCPAHRPTMPGVFKSIAACFLIAFLALQAQLVRSLVPMLSTTVLGCRQGAVALGRHSEHES